MLMDYLNEEKRLAKLADKVAKKREQKPHSKRLAKKAEKIVILQEKHEKMQAKRQADSDKIQARIDRRNEDISRRNENLEEIKAHNKQVFREIGQGIKEANAKGKAERQQILREGHERRARRRNSEHD